ncbi:MAG: hypothetical protein C0446_08370 [Chitinophaga sp.]|nr:hypothetical protein [Chitinophaga sp.]
MKVSIDYLAAKLEEIHNDVKELKGQVDELRQVEAGRKATQRFLAASISILGGVITWIASVVIGLK